MSGNRDPEESWGTDEKRVSLVPMACAMMQDVQERTLNEFHVDESCQYKWDIDRAEIVFFRKKRPIVHAKVQVIGSISRERGTWLWGWANDDIPSRATDKLSEVSQYGEEQGFQKLTLPEWIPDDTSDGHDMMYVAASILGASAVLHYHFGDLALFFHSPQFPCFSRPC